MDDYTFPFGQKLKRVEQSDKSPKKAFVLGVYASAVHARWVGKDGKQKVSALAIASEPCIFWNGDKKEATSVISSVIIPEELGRLEVPANKELNGPSGRLIDSDYLKPLNLDRSSVWFCDLLPESRVNDNQLKAIETHYTKELIREYNLPPATIPKFSKTDLSKEGRIAEILQELVMSRAETLILLGDLPIQYFLGTFHKNYQRLSDFAKDENSYGLPHEMTIEGKVYEIIPLCHPRQAGRLGYANGHWQEWHKRWMERRIEYAETQSQYS